MVQMTTLLTRAVNVQSKRERIRNYRRYVFEAGSLNRPEKGSVKVIEDKLIAKERSRKFELSKTDRFRYRTRYFTDSGIIGSKDQVIFLYCLTPIPERFL